MATGRELLAVARGELGYRESAGKRNKYGAWYGMDGVAWCMEFVQWVYATAGARLPYKTASCGALLNWYRANQPERIAEAPVPGCLVIFDLPVTKYLTDHVGLFESMSGDWVTTIDGNTSGESDANGGCVNRRTRKKNLVHAYIVPGELEEETVEKRFNTMEEIGAGAPWAAETVEKLIAAGALNGGTGRRDGGGKPADLDLSADMLRLLVINDRAGAFR